MCICQKFIFQIIIHTSFNRILPWNRTEVININNSLVTEFNTGTRVS